MNAKKSEVMAAIEWEKFYSNEIEGFTVEIDGDEKTVKVVREVE